MYNGIGYLTVVITLEKNNSHKKRLNKIYNAYHYNKVVVRDLQKKLE